MTSKNSSKPATYPPAPNFSSLNSEKPHGFPKFKRKKVADSSPAADSGSKSSSKNGGKKTNQKGDKSTGGKSKSVTLTFDGFDGGASQLQNLFGHVVVRVSRGHVKSSITV